VGSRVRLLEIVPWLLEVVPEEEKPELLSMVGEIFEVQRDWDGRVYVDKWWNENGRGSFSGHGYYAEPHEIELVKRSDGPTNAQNAPRPEWPLTRRRKWAAYIAKSVTDKFIASYDPAIAKLYAEATAAAPKP